MATTAFLRSQDCLRRHQPRSTFHHQDHKFTPQRRSKSNRRDYHHQKPVPVPVPVMGHVRILKRGEDLPKATTSVDSKTTSFRSDDEGLVLSSTPKRDEALPKTTKTEDSKTTSFGSDDEGLVLSSTERLGPEPEAVQKEIKVPDLYAGVGMLVESPSPSSLPLPMFLVKKEKNSNVATSDLRRLLKLDMAA